LLRVDNRVLEQVLEPLQRVLVHTVDVVQINDTEEEQLCAEGNSSETFTLHINFLFGDLGFGLSYGNFCGSLLRIGQGVDQVIRGQKLIDSVTRQGRQQVVLNLVQDGR